MSTVKTIETITTKQIIDLRNEAEAHGDDAMATLCDVALGGGDAESAMKACVEAIQAAEAMADCSDDAQDREYACDVATFDGERVVRVERRVCSAESHDQAERVILSGGYDVDEVFDVECYEDVSAIGMLYCGPHPVRRIAAGPEARDATIG